MSFLRNKPNSVARHCRAVIISLRAALLQSSNELPFRTPPRRGTLLFLRIGFTAMPCYHGRSMVAFDSRPKTSIHFSPFTQSSWVSIVSVALSRPYTLQCRGWVLPTIHCQHPDPVKPDKPQILLCIRYVLAEP